MPDKKSKLEEQLSKEEIDFEVAEAEYLEKQGKLPRPSVKSIRPLLMYAKVLDDEDPTEAEINYVMRLIEKEIVDEKTINKAVKKINQIRASKPNHQYIKERLNQIEIVYNYLLPASKPTYKS